jgi:hypothetical protein
MFEFKSKNINKKYLLLSFIIVIAIILMINAMNYKRLICETEHTIFLKENSGNSTLNEKNIYGNHLVFGDNINGYPYNIVPNIVHYILFSIHEIQFSHFISLLSVLLNQKPDQIIIHCDCNLLNGEYYKRILKIIPKTRTILTIRQIERPTKIFGRNLSKGWLNWHSADVTRIKLLLEFGGIYLDQDIYVVKSLDIYRKYEMTLGWDAINSFSNAIFIAHKNSRFLKLYLDSYRNYDSTQWTYNSQILPTESILKKKPELIHRVIHEFGTHGPVICPKLFIDYDSKWRQNYYAIHLFIRGKRITFPDWCFDGRKHVDFEFDDEVSKNLNTTYGEMARLVFNFEDSLNEVQSVA